MTKIDFHQKGDLNMEKKVETRKKIVKVVVWVVAIAALMLTMHMIVNNLNILDLAKTIHGG
jgi:cell division protein FtsL